MVILFIFLFNWLFQIYIVLIVLEEYIGEIYFYPIKVIVLKKKFRRKTTFIYILPKFSYDC